MHTAADDVLSPEAAKGLEEAISALARAFRAYQLYLPNNPTRAATLERARGAFANLFTKTPSVSLTVSETAFHSGNAVVYRDEERGSAGLPWLMYRDGLRTLTLTAGFEEGELDSLLDILLASKSAPAEDDDLITMLWVADFHCLTYRNVELALDFDAASATERGSEDGALPERTITAAGKLEAEMPEEGPPPAFVSFNDADATLHFLSSAEVTRLQQDLRREYSSDPRRKVVAALYDIVEGESEAAAQIEVCGILDHLLSEALVDGAFPVAAFILREARVALSRSGDRIDSEARATLGTLAARLSEADIIEQLLEAIDAGAQDTIAPLLDDLFAELRPAAMVPLLAWYGSGRTSPARAAVERAISRLGSRHTAELARLFDHHDQGVVRGAVLIAKLVPAPPLVAPLERTIGSGDTALRTDAVVALSAIASPAAMQVIERSCRDPEREVRIAALRAIALRGYQPARGEVQALLQKRSMRQADLTEKMAAFEAFAAISGDDGVSLLDGILNGRGLLGNREPAEMRACAAHALGRIRSAAAIASLEKCLRTEDVVVRSAVARALREER